MIACAVSTARNELLQLILNAAQGEAEIVGLAITEYLPWSAIKLAEQLRGLPLLGG